MTRSSARSEREPGSARKSATCDEGSWSLSRTTIRSRPPPTSSRRPLAPEADDPLERVPVVDLEAHVVGEAATELRDAPEHPVRVAARCEHAGLRCERLTRRRRPLPRASSSGTRHRRGRARGTATSASAAIARGDPRSSARGAPLRSFLEGRAESHRDEHEAGQGEPWDTPDRDHCPGELTASAAMSNSVSRRRPSRRRGVQARRGHRRRGCPSSDRCAATR